MAKFVLKRWTYYNITLLLFSGFWRRKREKCRRKGISYNQATFCQQLKDYLPFGDKTFLSIMNLFGFKYQKRSKSSSVAIQHRPITLLPYIAVTRFRTKDRSLSPAAVPTFNWRTMDTSLASKKEIFERKKHRQFTEDQEYFEGVMDWAEPNFSFPHLNPSNELLRPHINIYVIIKLLPKFDLINKWKVLTWTRGNFELLLELLIEETFASLKKPVDSIWFAGRQYACKELII